MPDIVMTGRDLLTWNPEASQYLSLYTLHIFKLVTLCDVGGAIVPPVYGKTALLFCWSQQDMILGHSYMLLFIYFCNKEVESAFWREEV